MPDCVIDVGHPAGTPAVWVNVDIPEHVVCNHHRQQYDTAYHNYDIKWKPIMTEASTEEQLRIASIQLCDLFARAEKAEKALESALAYIRGCPIHGNAACPEEYMLNQDGTTRAGYSGHWNESFRCGLRPSRPDPTTTAMGGYID